MILITGAGGKTGRAIVKALASFASVCAFVHRKEQEFVLRSFGAEKVILGDMQDEDAIRLALVDVTAIYHICPNMNPHELEIGNLLIGAAVKAGVGNFVYHSVLHPQTEKMVHHWQKMRVEEMLFESRLPFTILQPAPYMQNLLSGWKRVVEEGILQVPYSVHSPFSFVDLEDVAEVAKTVLTDMNYQNAIFELVGTPALSHVDVAEAMGRVLNRQVRAEAEEIDRWRHGAQQSAELGEYAVENLVRMFEYYNRWGLVGSPNALRWILGREPTSLETFIERIKSGGS